MKLTEIREIVGDNIPCIAKNGSNGEEFWIIFDSNGKEFHWNLLSKKAERIKIIIGKWDNHNFDTDYELIDYFEKEPLQIEKIYNTLGNLVKLNKFPFNARPVNWKTDRWWNSYYGKLDYLTFTGIYDECRAKVKGNYCPEGIYFKPTKTVSEEHCNQMWEVVPYEEKEDI